MNILVEDQKFDDYVADEDDIQVDDYDITVTPNDFNVMTLNTFVESGAVKIPGFQRNFVWDIKRSSKLIESLVLGLPVPQIFLYEKSRNNFLVIDGQQRLMSIYYFIKKRFPRREKRVELRGIFDENGQIPEYVLHDDQYFQSFNLRLSENLPGKPNRFHGMNYATMDDYKTQFDLRPIRNIVVRQNSPSDDDSSIYEIFNRLNTGGINLRQQEIRASMFHSDFYLMLNRINGNVEWRRILNSPEPDLNLKDIEIILRGFAMLIDGANYTPSMLKFLNQFSKKCAKHSDNRNGYLEKLFLSFLEACQLLPDDAFINKRNRRFNIALYEAVFAAACEGALKKGKKVFGQLQKESLQELETDEEFTRAALEGTTRTANVALRLGRARKLISVRQTV